MDHEIPAMQNQGILNTRYCPAFDVSPAASDCVWSILKRIRYVPRRDRPVFYLSPHPANLRIDTYISHLRRLKLPTNNNLFKFHIQSVKSASPIEDNMFSDNFFPRGHYIVTL